MMNSSIPSARETLLTSLRSNSDISSCFTGAENNTFGIPGVTEHANFLKEIWDAEKVRKKLMDCKSIQVLHGSKI